MQKLIRAMEAELAEHSNAIEKIKSAMSVLKSTESLSTRSEMSSESLPRKRGRKPRGTQTRSTQDRPSSRKKGPWIQGAVLARLGAMPGARCLNAESLCGLLIQEKPDADRDRVLEVIRKLIDNGKINQAPDATLYM